MYNAIYIYIYICIYKCIYIYIYINRYPISYIQYGNIPIRDSPTHTHPTPCPPPLRPVCGGPSMGWGGVGVNPLWIYFHIGYRILDIYLHIYIYIYIYLYIYIYIYILYIYIYICVYIYIVY